MDIGLLPIPYKLLLRFMGMTLLKKFEAVSPGGRAAIVLLRCSKGTPIEPKERKLS